MKFNHELIYRGNVGNAPLIALSKPFDRHIFARISPMSKTFDRQRGAGGDMVGSERRGTGLRRKRSKKGEQKMDRIILFAGTIGQALITYFTATVVHEGGHVLAGLIQGWRFDMMVVGPFKLYRAEDGKVKLGIEKDTSLWGGVGGTLPPAKSEKRMKQYAAILLAGPLASVILGAVFTLIWLFVNRGVFFMLMAFVPIGMGIACMIPGVKTGILYNDGTRFSRIRKGGQTSAEEEAIFDAATLRLFDNDTPYDENGIEVMTASKDAEIRYLGHYYGYLNAKQANDSEKEQSRLDCMKAIEDKVPSFIKTICVISE